jgi:hypothetical protein
MLVGVPLAGNLWPRWISFLPAMRYYAGNWAYGVWLFRGESYRKLDRLTKSSARIYDQLARFYDRATSVGLVGKVMAFRLMHLHGRALPALIPKAVSRLEDYEYLDGEMVAGLALGWNFGDGHLHREELAAERERLAAERERLAADRQGSPPTAGARRQPPGLAADRQGLARRASGSGRQSRSGNVRHPATFPWRRGAAAAR